MKTLNQALADEGQALLNQLEEVYIHLHKTPELSMKEVNTSEFLAEKMRALGYEVTTKVGITGVVSVLKNGDGPTVMLRADMDALPMAEVTGLPYEATGVTTVDDDGNTVGLAHSCGHDMHMTWGLGAAEILAKHRDLWQGTVMIVFQPGEETAAGAAAMVADMPEGRFPKPDVILGQHVMVGEAGTVFYRPGVSLSAGDSMQIKLFGRGGHGSMPEKTVDPVLLAATTTVRLHTIVSRELAATEPAVLTIGSLQAGTKENIIPDDATLKLNMRTYSDEARTTMINAIHRICEGESTVAGSPKAPEFTTINRYPLTDNDTDATEVVGRAFADQFGISAFEIPKPAPASEDFSVFGRTWGVPYVFWFVGGTDPQLFKKAVAEGTRNKIPGNHSPQFAPVIHPTLETGLNAMLSAAGAWLGKTA